MVMRALGRIVSRYRWAVLILAVLSLPLAVVFGGPVKAKLSAGGFDDPAAESTQAARILEDTFGAGSPNVVLLVTARGGSVDDPAVAERGLALTEELGTVPGLADAVSYWSLGSPAPLRGTDGTQALVLGRVVGDEDDLRDAAEGIAERFERSDEIATVEVGGAGEIFRQVTDQAEADLQKAETLSFPVTLVLLLVVFGSVVAAALPLAVGILAVLGTLLVLTVFASFTQVSVFALNLTTAMGLGLAIDYSLFMVSRFREELAAGHEPPGALQRTMQTAGRTVAFSAFTVAISLAALLVFPLAFLRSFAYAGVGVVAMAAVGAIVVLPALLAVLGRRIEKGSIGRRKRQPVVEASHGFWYRRATWVMKRPGRRGRDALPARARRSLPALRRRPVGRPGAAGVVPGAQGARRAAEELRQQRGRRPHGRRRAGRGYHRRRRGRIRVVVVEGARGGSGRRSRGVLHRRSVGEGGRRPVRAFRR